MIKQQKKPKAENSQTRYSSTSADNSDSIPADVIIEIFSRLTANYVWRLRCVSKEWASIFSSRDFTHTFFTRSSARPRLLFTFHVDGKLFSYSAPQPRNPDQDLSHVVLDNHVTIPTRMGSFLIHRPVRGLLCPSDMWFKRGCNDSKKMVICNPSTGQFINLPAARTRRAHVRTYLGYDPIKEEYKVLCMSLRTKIYPKISEEHQVLTLGTGRKLFWRMIECSLQRFPESGGICINGVLYYLAYQNDGFGGGQNFIVVCFDVSSEKFKPLEINLSFPSTLINYKGQLGAIQFDSVGFSGGRSTSLGLMVLDDAEQHIWSNKTYVLPPFWRNLGVNARLNVVGMTGDSEIVFSPSILSDPFYIFYYDVERNTVVKVRVQGIDFVNHQYI